MRRNAPALGPGRFQANGVDALIDAILSGGDDAGDTRDRLWQIAWARGYQDILLPLPVPETRIEGHVVYRRAFARGRELIAIDDGERLVGVLGAIDLTPLGAKVRLVPLYGQSAVWSVKVLATLGCGLRIRFDGTDGRRTGAEWVDRLREALHDVRDREATVRRGIEAERRTVPYVHGPRPFREQVEEADKALRERVLASAYTDDESRALAKAKSDDAVQRVVAMRNKRLVDLYRAEAELFRATIPALRADWDRQMAEYTAARTSIDRFNNVDASSRAVTDASLRCSQLLETIDAASLQVKAADLARVEADPRAHFQELVATIELLFELVPNHLRRRYRARETNLAG